MQPLRISVNEYPQTGPSTCSGLEPSWENLKTDEIFPVDSGTVVAVTCEVGFLLKGRDTITCIVGTTFSSVTTPSCVWLGECLMSEKVFRKNAGDGKNLAMDDRPRRKQTREQLY